MGSDDLFKKRKARTSNALARQQQLRTQSPRSLIVCEGSKTEPHYLSELREMWGIPHAWVSIKSSEGSSPDRVVQTAEKLYAEDAQMGDSFDQVFCVFDPRCTRHVQLGCSAYTRIEGQRKTFSSHHFNAVL